MQKLVFPQISFSRQKVFLLLLMLIPSVTFAQGLSKDSIVALSVGSETYFCAKTNSGFVAAIERGGNFFPASKKVRKLRVRKAKAGSPKKRKKIGKLIRSLKQAVRQCRNFQNDGDPKPPVVKPIPSPTKTTTPTQTPIPTKPPSTNEFLYGDWVYQYSIGSGWVESIRYSFFSDGNFTFRGVGYSNDWGCGSFTYKTEVFGKYSYDGKSLAMLPKNYIREKFNDTCSPSSNGSSAGTYPDSSVRLIKMAVGVTGHFLEFPRNFTDDKGHHLSCFLDPVAGYPLCVFPDTSVIEFAREGVTS